MAPARDLPSRRKAPPRDTRVVRPEGPFGLLTVWKAFTTLPDEVRPVEFHSAKARLAAHNPVVLVGWVDVPGDNAQRTTHHRRADESWRTTLKADFAACWSAQRFTYEAAIPFREPRVHIIGVVGGRSDLSALGGRYKRVLDLLQPARVSYRKGARSRVVELHSGLVGLIENDRDVLPTYAEVVTRTRDERGRTSRRVVVLAWEKEWYA